MARNRRGSSRERAWNPGRFGIATVILGLGLIAGGCDSGNGNRLFIGPTASPTGRPATATPTPGPSGTPSPVVSPTKAASVTPTPAGPTPTSSGPTATATPAKVALWVENTGSSNGTSNTGFVAEFTGGTLTSPGATVAPTPTVQNMSAAIVADTSGVNFDNSDNQWVSVCGHKGPPLDFGRIAQFNTATLAGLKANPKPTPDVLLSDDGTGKLVSCPWATTFDSAGDMWVANSNQNVGPGGFITEYQPAQLVAPGGHPTPFMTLTDSADKLVSPTGVVFDSGGAHLVVSDFGSAQFGGTAAGQILVFNTATLPTTGGTHDVKASAKLTDPSIGSPVNGAFDSSGNLWIADCSVSEIYMFPKAALGTGAASATIIFKAATVTGTGEQSLNCPAGITFDSAGNLWYTNFFGVAASVNGAVGEFSKAQLAGPSGTPQPAIFLKADTGGNALNFPLGLNFGPQH
jgi:hypothetical protein